VLHVHGSVLSLGGWRAANGSLRVSKEGLQFTEHGERAHPDHDFKVSCAEVMEVKANRVGPPWFHVKIRARNYDLTAGSDWRQAGYNKTESLGIVAAILAACGQR